MKKSIRNTHYLTSCKLLCVFLCLIMTLMCCPLNVYSDSEALNKKSEITSSEPIVIGSPDGHMEYTDLDQMRQMGRGEKTIEELSSMSLDLNDLPELISLDEALQKGHVYRLREQEDTLNSVVFQNKNGEKTVYMFTEPVKYVDSTGLIRDKSTKIQAISDKIFAMTDNSVQAYFPRDIGEGISVHYNKYTIQMIPIYDETDTTVLVFDKSKNTITYSNVFSSEHISLVYDPLMQGIKEDIVLNQYTGQSVFQFSLLAEGLSAIQENGNWILRDVTGKKIASFGEIVVKDSAGHETIGTLDISTWSEGSFHLTITVSEEFLQSSATTYPVYIDPTAYIWETSYYYDDNDYSYEYDSIIDVGVYNGTSADASDDNGHHYLGGVEGGRVIYKLPDFYNIVYGQYRNFSDYQIGSVKIKAYFEAGPATMISAYPMSQTWDEDTYGENPILIDDNYDLWSVNSSLTAQNTYIYSSLEGTYDIDITNIVRGWAQFNKGKTTAASKNPSFGLILCSDAARAIRSREYTEYGSNVRIQMDYSYIAGEYFAYSLDGSYRFLRRNSATSITTNSFSNSDAQKWIFEYIGNDNYYIHSVYDTNNVLCRNGNSVSLSSLDTYPTNEYIWTITNASGGGVIIKSMASPQYVLSINGTELILQQLPSTGSDAYQQCRWGILSLDYYVPMTNFKLSDDWIKPGTTKYFNVRPTPENASWYSGSYYDWTISDTSKVTNSSNKLTGKSTGVIYLTGKHKITGMSRSFRIVCGDMREGTYMLLNKGTGRYMDVKGPSKESGAYIHQWDYHTNPQEKWKISMLSNGEYIIQSVYSQKYLRIENGSNASGASMIQYEDYSWTSTRWKIEETSSGAYKICSMLTNYAVSVPSNSNSNGTTLVQLPYTNDSNYRDEWIFDNIGETHGIDNGKVYHIKAVHSGKGFDATAAGTNNGTLIKQHEIGAGKQWQRWKVEYVGNGDYKFRDMNSGKLLSVNANSSGTSYVHLWEDQNDTGQLFRIRENVDGSYTFLSKCSYYTMVLEVENGNSDNGTTIRQYYNTNSNYQKFRLVESVADMSFLAPAIRDLYQYATGYAPNASVLYREHLVLQYIRRDAYSDALWDIAAGKVDTSFVEYVNSRNDDLNLIFNSALRKSINGPGNSAGSFITDKNGEDVDFYHLCATLDAMLYSNIYPPIISGVEKDLAGWALDLVTTAPEALQRVKESGLTQNQTNVYNAMYNILASGDPYSSFSRADFLADIDAAVIYKSLVNMQMDSFEKHFEYHYNYNYKIRYSLFLGSKTTADLKNAANKYLSAVQIASYIIHKVPLENDIALTTAQKNGLRDAFVDYFMEKLNNG